MNACLFFNKLKEYNFQLLLIKKEIVKKTLKDIMKDLYSVHISTQCLHFNETKVSVQKWKLVQLY